MRSGGRVRYGVLAGVFAAAALAVRAQGFTGPAEWRRVNTNAVARWQAEQARAVAAEGGASWPGVVADVRKREVRLLAEAVGHREGVTAEFVLVGPLSDRAYEAVAVTVASPGDVARAVERIGLPRGGGVGSRPLRLWPYGERVTVGVRRLGGEGGAERPLQSLLRDTGSGSALVGAGGLVFTGGRWDGAGHCLTDTNLPCAVIALYNEPETIFDVPFQVGQSEVYGRLSLAETLPHGALLEVVVRPCAQEGGPRLLPLTVTARPAPDGVALSVEGAGGESLCRAGLKEALAWLRACADGGRELFVTLAFDEALTVRRAAEVARVFAMLDGQGLKLDGKSPDGLYARAFLPQEKWREREGRTPQPFEVHVAAGSGAKRLVFVEEDWNVEGLDPKLTPRDHPFERWEELPGLVERAGGAESRVSLLFVFVPGEMPLAGFMPGVRAVAERLPLVYVFAE